VCLACQFITHPSGLFVGLSVGNRGQQYDMGCCTSKATPDGTYEPSAFAMSVAVKSKTNFKATTFDSVHTAGAKILVVCTDDGKVKMTNGKVFNSGNHATELFLPLLHFKAAGFDFEFATVSGGAVVIEIWGFPKKDKAVNDLYTELKPKLDAPTKLADVDASLAGYAGIYLPGGHGAMVNLPESVVLGKLLHAAHAAALPTMALCHGPAALAAASKVEGAEFPYKGYKMVSFPDKVDKTTLPQVGYIPGPMPWLVQAKLASLGMEVTNASEKGATCIDRELITGDGSSASNKFGLVAAPILVDAWAKRAA
jgi:molecular chaperone Hsp31 and glyoxalase 3